MSCIVLRVKFYVIIWYLFTTLRYQALLLNKEGHRIARLNSVVSGFSVLYRSWDDF